MAIQGGDVVHAGHVSDVVASALHHLLESAVPPQHAEPVVDDEEDGRDAVDDGLVDSLFGHLLGAGQSGQRREGATSDHALFLRITSCSTFVAVYRVESLLMDVAQLGDLLFEDVV